MKIIGAAIGCMIALALAPANAAGAGQFVVNKPSVEEWVVYGPGQTRHYAKTDTVPGGTAVAITVPAVQPHPWDAGASALIPVALHKGEAVAAAFWLRSKTAAHVTASLQGNAPPYTAFATAELSPGPDWKLAVVSGAAGDDIPAFGATIALQLGGAPQSIELGPVTIVANADGSLPDDEALKRELEHSEAAAVEPLMIDTGSVKIAATLRLPAGKGPFPAVVLFAGGGPYARGGFHAIESVLKGVAIVDFDKRGSGESSGKREDSTIADLIGDGAAVTAYLKTRPDIDPKKIVVLGYSEGAIVAPAVAAREPTVSFLVILGAGAERFDTAALRQWVEANQAAGTSEADIALGRELMPKLFALIETAGSDEDAKARILSFLAPFVANKKMTQQQAERTAAANSPRAVREYLSYDPAATLRKVKVPVLVISGSLDHAVPPSVHFPLIREALKDNPDATVVELPGLNHFFQKAVTGSYEESKTLTEPQLANAELLRLIGERVAKHVQ